MINNTIKNLQSKILSLENKLNKLEKKSLELINDLGFSVWTKNLLNFNIISKKSFKIINIENKFKNHLFFQLKVKFLNYSSQDIKFDLFCDNIQIGTETQSYNNGLHEATICGTYQNLISDTIEIRLSANPKNSKQITLIKTILTIWGISQSLDDEYNAIETNSNYLLSYISNNRLYYKLFDKTTSDSSVDFSFYNESKSHSICKDSSDDIYLFRVDLNGNLFFSNFPNSQEIFISKNVDKVTSCMFDNSVYLAYISEGECYYGEIFNNIVISNKKITSLFGKFNNCYLYFDNIKNKCYLILHKDDNSNYLLENISSSFKSSESICADISLTISTNTEGE